ncbi:MAG TPA: DUF2218 domain-containing protein [Mycobacteriales bacterium]|jgi:hypothetical protein|nr:DUF2218 domain-containing protein [Mycobacteriales bacterium]
MLTSQAQVTTDRPGRYLVQLARHANEMSRFRGHRPRNHGDDNLPPPQVRQVEWSDTDGVVSLSWGRWVMHATQGTLILRAEADDADSLQRIQDLVAARLGTIARRDDLAVVWEAIPGIPGGFAECGPVG